MTVGNKAGLFAFFATLLVAGVWNEWGPSVGGPLGLAIVLSVFVKLLAPVFLEMVSDE